MNGDAKKVMQSVACKGIRRCAVYSTFFEGSHISAYHSSIITTPQVNNELLNY
ncbi:hypothetical protein KFK09_020585 [Dendrobium nobile]|uniref:Uncharacterized protein n=1 Tax=Dendrobium nobile TaxID=94219 RepID=A0A8T3ANK9_DENNO|nr:hypothetical protein KFK09_020585 [Dendrobium nobile]